MKMEEQEEETLCSDCAGELKWISQIDTKRDEVDYYQVCKICGRIENFVWG